MTEWIKRGERVHNVSYSRSFEWADLPGAGFGFDCDENGELLRNEAGEYIDSFGKVWHPAAHENYQMCLRGEDENGAKILDRGIARWESSYWEPGVLRCDRCGGEVVIDMLMTNTCDNCSTCGQPEDRAWHLLTAEQCDASQKEHGFIGCFSPAQHHEFHRCAADYNSGGQLLAPREQWGWDTGESLSDILMADERLT